MSPEQQFILFDLLKNGPIDFFKQGYYTSRRSFNLSMNELFNCGWIDKRIIRIDNRFGNEYKLTAEGVIFVKMLGNINEH